MRALEIGCLILVATAFLGGFAASAYINSGPSYGGICAELRSQGMVAGASRGGRVLRSVSCSDNGHAFSIRGYLD